MQTKLSHVLAAMDAGDWKRAFSIASKFGALGKQKVAITRAQSAILKPDFYRQIGQSPAAIIEQGKAAMRVRFEPMRNKKSAKARGLSAPALVSLALLAACAGNILAVLG